MTKEAGWPEELEALTAAAEHHVLLLENEAVRVLDTRIGAGERTAVHHHRWGGVIYVVSWSDFVRRDGEGNVLFDSRAGAPMAPGPAVWVGPLGPHWVENVGQAELRAIAVEVKGARVPGRLRGGRG